MPPARRRTRLSIAAAVTAALTVPACAAAPPPAPPCPSSAPAVAAPSRPTPAPPTDPYLRVRLQPHAEPSRYVHVDVELLAAAPLTSFRVARGDAALVSHVTLADASGAAESGLRGEAGGGATLVAARPLVGVTRLAYDVATNTESPWKPLAERVLDDRFVGAGEGLLLLPEALDDQVLPVELVVDGAFLRAPNAASSWGVGATRRTRARPRALRHLTFLVGSMGAAEFDASEGHDEIAWLGSTAFDARPVGAEIAVTRSTMAELFKAVDPPHGTVLFVIQPRPLGSYTTTPRSGGILLQIGPSEPWSAPLRVSVAQQLVRPWVGGELWIGPTDAEHVAESYWFSEGVARFMATRVLARMGALKPDEVRDELVGESLAIAGSPHKGADNATLAALAKTDETARAHLVARGALYAARLNALVRDKSKGGWSLDTVVLELLEKARREKKPLPTSDWVDAVARTLGDKERDAFERTILRGEEVVLPGDVLGRCYRAGVTEAPSFELGFDAEATRDGPSGEVVGLAPKGPAARAGLKPGDRVEADYRDGHPEVPVTLTVRRGAETLHLTYAPRGPSHRVPTWTRVGGLPDERCGDAF